MVQLARADLLPRGDVAFLLHLDDLHFEKLDPGDARVMAVGGLIVHADGASEHVRSADREAIADALARAEAHYGCSTVSVVDGWPGDLQVIAPWASVGIPQLLDAPDIG